jgi:septation ring formation regulator EzrA
MLVCAFTVPLKLPVLQLTYVTPTTIDTRLADSSAKAPPTIELSGNLSGERGLAASNETQKVAHSRSTAAKKHQTETGPSITDLLNTTRTELAEAQRSRAELRDRLDQTTNEAEKFRKKIGQDGRQINSLEGEVAQQQKRLKDVDEELRGKAKLLDVCIIPSTPGDIPRILASKDQSLYQEPN